MYPIPQANVLFNIGEQGKALTPAERSEMVDRREEFVQEMTKSTLGGVVGETTWGDEIDRDRPFRIPTVRHNSERQIEVRKALGEVEMAKSIDTVQLQAGLYGARASVLAKEWTLRMRGAI